ncbi:MAG TPA: UDP-glucose/GDP-mannose dehydrogenase family protein, partial [Thermomicrobiales bacterium]|nr:UDP-glucose/GDP-mannose dehydrogenase family protein [Thermomicrobiales bacterium]
DLTNRRIGVWGLSFKQNTDDMRESPAVDIIQMIEQRGAIVQAYDPAAIENARVLLKETRFCSSPYGAIEGADALCVVTPWNEFKHADLKRVKSVMRTPLILDGRNMYDPDDMRRLGFTYVGVGR